MNLPGRKGIRKKKKKTESNWSGKEVFCNGDIDISEKLLRRRRRRARGSEDNDANGGLCLMRAFVGQALR